MVNYGTTGMDQRARRNAAILLLVGLAAVILLSPALGDLQLGAGNPFPGASGASFQTEPATTAPRLSAAESLPAFRGILAVSLVVLVTLLVTRLAILANPRRLLGIAAAIAVIILLLLSLPRIPSGGAVALPPESAAPRVPSAEVATSPLGTPPASVVWIAGMLVLAAGVVALIVALRPRPAPISVTHGIAAEASRALGEIQAGADSTSVIVRCYLQLASLIQKERGLSRHRGLTIREFEYSLESLGLPREPLWRLRNLFEAVRYGARRMSAREEEDAVDSLNELVAFLKGDAA
jgi:hypothetical protein